jgi:NAD(P)-dependent dehydrogenase (short-subunit alcohol dehydrogenase family)
MTGARGFEGKVAIVTGGASGIGKATALLLARGGAAVMICARRRARLEAAVDEARTMNLEIHGVVADVTLADDVRRLIQRTVESLGGIDILVNNAAVMTTGSVLDTEEAEWDRVVATSLKGAYLVSRQAIPEMSKRGGGAIVHVASQHAFATAKGRAAYTAAKAGLAGLTRAMALDHAPQRIRVNAVCPGAVDTEFLRDGWAALNPGAPVDTLIAELGAKHPLGRVGRPEDVAEAIAFLASAHAEFLTGVLLPVEGGTLARLSIAAQN